MKFSCSYAWMCFHNTATFLLPKEKESSAVEARILRTQNNERLSSKIRSFVRG
jgi:hypothetical protein